MRDPGGVLYCYRSHGIVGHDTGSVTQLTECRVRHISHRRVGYGTRSATKLTHRSAGSVPEALKSLQKSLGMLTELAEVSGTVQQL